MQIIHLKFTRKNRGIVLITCLYVLVFVLMLPLRDQAFQDDWAYILSLKKSLINNSLLIVDWSSSTLVFMLIFAGVFSKLFGFSIALTHFTSILLTFLGTICFYLLLKRLKIDELKSTIFAILYFSHPWIFQFSYTFLTDIPFVSLAVISLYLFTKGLQDKNTNVMFLAGLSAGCSFLVRQLGLAFPASLIILFLFDILIFKKINKLSLLISSLVPFAVIFIAYSYWQSLPNNLTLAQYQVQTTFSQKILPYLLPVKPSHISITFGYYENFIQRIIFYFNHLIIFLTPILIIFKISLKNSGKFFSKYYRGIIVAFSVYLFLFFMDYFYHLARNRFEIAVPDFILRYGVIWNNTVANIWKVVIVVSTPVWLTLIGSQGQIFFSKVFSKKVQPPKKLFYFLTFALVIFGFFYEKHILLTELKHTSLYTNLKHADFLTFLLTFPKVLDHQFLTILSYSWFTVFGPLTLIGSIMFVFTFCKFKHKYTNLAPETVFLVLVAMIFASLIIFFPYSYWPQYTIPLVPFFYLLLAKTFAKSKVNYPLTVLVLLFFLFFSFTSTHKRYHNYGIQWYLANQLVEKGIAPADINFPDESWLPYWLYKETFEQKIASDFGNNKYLMSIGEMTTWREVKTDPNYYYLISPVNLQANAKLQKELIFETGNFSSGIGSYNYYIYKIKK